MQEVERLAKADDWSVSAWLRNAIESQVSRAQRERDNRRSAAKSRARKAGIERERENDVSRRQP